MPHMYTACITMSEAEQVRHGVRVRVGVYRSAMAISNCTSLLQHQRKYILGNQIKLPRLMSDSKEF